MKKIREDCLPEMYRFQKNLKKCRELLGWSCDEFGQYVGLSRQTVYNIETNKCDISKTQYIAMRSIIDSEIIANKEETKAVALFLEMFVDNPEKYGKEEKKVLEEKINLNMPAIAAGTASRKDVSEEIVSIIVSAVGATALAMLFANDKFISNVTGWIYSSKKRKK